MSRRKQNGRREDSIPHGTPSGYSYWGCRCEVCVKSKRVQDRAYHAANRDAVKQHVKGYRERNLEAVRERDRWYREANRERLTESKRRYYEEHKDAIIRRVAEWVANDPERRKQQTARYRVRLAPHRCRRPPEGRPGTPRPRDITMTFDVYGHLFPVLDEQITGRLEDLHRSASRPEINGTLAGAVSPLADTDRK